MVFMCILTYLLYPIHLSTYLAIHIFSCNILIISSILFSHM